MITHRLWKLFVVIAVWAGPAAAEPYEFTITQRNSLNLAVFGKTPLTSVGSNKLEANLSGAEESSCIPYGRVSNANGLADVAVVDRRADGLRLELTGKSSTLGGHYRDCVTCVAGQCIGILPHDTTATATSQTATTVAITFAANADEARYFLDVGLDKGNIAPVLSVSDQAGKAVPASVPGVYDIQGRPGAIFYVNVALDVHARNEGMGSSENALGTARVDLKLRRAPLLSANSRFEPFIKGGKPTSAYKNVGAVLIRGELHCTASVVGPRTLLTAAHCVEGYENQVTTMTFLVGPNIVQPTMGPVSIVGYAYPDGSDRGFKFERATLRDDIAVLYLDKDAGVEAVSLHNGEPAWDRVLSDGESLIFVGYGFDVIQSELVGASIKREAAWQINGIESRRVTFQVPKRNTCKGDSGGPAFLIVEGRLIQVAVTSGGAADCSSGFETRIDSFRPWLAQRIR